MDKNVDIRTLSKESLIDIKDIKKDRIPRCFLCEGVIVKVNYSQTEETLEDKLSGYFLT